jgi:peroxiredoxin
MTIKVGDTIPAGKFQTMTSDGPAEITTHELFDGKKVVFFAVPGAYTPTCHANHLPGFIENHAALREKGVDEIAVTSVNDVHVMGHWAKASGGKDKIRFLADGNAGFAKSIGMDIDLSIAGMGVRSRRYAMIVDNGTVTHLNIEEKPGSAEISSAANILKNL